MSNQQINIQFPDGSNKAYQVECLLVKRNPLANLYIRKQSFVV